MTVQEIPPAQGPTRTSRKKQIVRIASPFVKNGENRKSFWTKWNCAGTSLRFLECRSALHKRVPLHAASERRNLRSSIEALEALRSKAPSRLTTWLRTER